MPGPKPKLSFRVDHDTYNTLKSLADMENKSLSDYTREVIEIGIGKKITAEQQMLDEFRLTCAEMKDFMARAVKASAGALWFSRMGIKYNQEMTQYLSELARQSNVKIDNKSSEKKMADCDEMAQKYEKHYLEASWDKL